MEIMLFTLLLAQQVVLPNERLHAVCQGGQWVNVAVDPAQGEPELMADCLAVPPPPPPPSSAIVVDHRAVSSDAFASVPLAPVQSLRVMSVDRSVGGNIANGLTTCLAVESAEARSFCTRWSWNNGSYPSPPMTWTAHPLPRWQYYYWPGQPAPNGMPSLPCHDESTYVACFESYLDRHAGEWDVVSMQPSYLEAGDAQLTAADYLASYERVRARHPALTIMLHTSSLSRVPSAANASFNDAVRAYVTEHGGVLIDVADIETFDPYGQPWFAGGVPVIAPYYTSETNGGHLGSPSAGMIRLAMAWWIALDQIAAR